MWAKSCGQFAIAFYLFAVPISVGAHTVQSPTSQLCGVDPARPAHRIFANPDGKHGWREYRRVEDVPALELGSGVLARLWAGRDRHALITMEEPSEDFAAYTHYCFDKAGRLVQLKFELRTAWGWGYRLEGQIVKGALANRMSEFFAAKTEERISKPEQADDVSEALKPHLYLRVSQLPFSKLLRKLGR